MSVIDGQTDRQTDPCDRKSRASLRCAAKKRVIANAEYSSRGLNHRLDYSMHGCVGYVIYVPVDISITSRCDLIVSCKTRTFSR